MRVSENTNFDLVRETLQRSKGRMEHLQNQSSTLRKLNSPSDDPVAAAKVLEIRTDKVNNEQYQVSAKLAEAFLSNSEQAVSELADIVVRAKEIAIQQSSSASSNDDTRVAVAEEVAQMFQQAINVANRRVGERYLFGGYKTNTPPVTEDGKYIGDNGQMTVEIGRDVFVSMNVPGNEIFNSDRKMESKGTQPEDLYEKPTRAPASADNYGDAPKKQNVNIFEEIMNLRIGLLTGDVDTIRNTLDRFDQIYSNLNATRARVGSRINGIQNISQSLDRQKITQAQLSSHLEDADMAQVVSDLAKEEAVFRSALQSSQKLIQPSLLDFLK